MTAALIVIDMQNDFLTTRKIFPKPQVIIKNCAELLCFFREQNLPIIHVVLTIDSVEDNRMPHWQSSNISKCISGTKGHMTPEILRPLQDETVINKQYFSAFTTGELSNHLKRFNAERIVLTGVHLHTCVSTTAIDAYQLGYEVWIAEDAVASYNPLLAEQIRLQVSGKYIHFVSNERIKQKLTTPDNAITQSYCHYSPHNSSKCWEIPFANDADINSKIIQAYEAWLQWREIPFEVRKKHLLKILEIFALENSELAHLITEDIGKPITYSKTELNRCYELIMSLQNNCDQLVINDGNIRAERQPHGIIAIITPWNHPLAIGLGKILPALLYGNVVIWKPALQASRIVQNFFSLFQRLNLTANILTLIQGDAVTARSLMSHDKIDAVSITGSSHAGFVAQSICASRRVPLQAELGGNNAVIVWSDVDIAKVAEEVALAAFGFAGQRCTATRRVIIHQDIFKKFLDYLTKATANLIWSDPKNSNTIVGPLINIDKLSHLDDMLQRCLRDKMTVIQPHLPANFAVKEHGAYFPPTIVICDDENHEIVQTETFGPILVVQKCENWENALYLVNQVDEGLVAGIFTHEIQLQNDFIKNAQAGVIKINQATTDIDIKFPFGGWKHSGLGPPEHGIGNIEFFTRWQAIYS